MDKYPDQKRAVQYLYPPIDPFDQRMVDMGDGHRIYVEQCGNSDGIPVVILHGGRVGVQPGHEAILRSTGLQGDSV